MIRKKTPLIVVCGPTASGKTALAVRLAGHFGGEVISADSMQIYRRMEIATAKPSPEEMDGIPHHLIDFLDPEEPFSVAQYVDLAKTAIRDVWGRGRMPVICGGTGLYIESLSRNIRFAEMTEAPEIRRELAVLADERGNGAVWELLRDCDPDLAAKLHPNNRGRVIRGIEVYRTTGIPMTEWQRRSRLEPPDYRLCMLGIEWPRQELYGRIDQRVDQMLEQGLLEEAEDVLNGGLGATAAQAIGYKELAGYFRGEKTREEAVEDIKRETRRYAKRQMTWFRRDERIHWLNAAGRDLSELFRQAVEIAESTLIEGGAGNEAESD